MAIESLHNLIRKMYGNYGYSDRFETYCAFFSFIISLLLLLLSSNFTAHTEVIEDSNFIE